MLLLECYPLRILLLLRKHKNLELCPFCGLVPETATHIMLSCSFSRNCWALVAIHIGWNESRLLDLLNEDWMCHSNANGSVGISGIREILATCAWHLWKARCDLIFNSTRPQPQQLVKRVMEDIQEHNWKLMSCLREYLHHSNYNQSVSLLCDASWTDSNSNCGLGFIIIKGQNSVLMAGCKTSIAESSLAAEVQAINWATTHINTDAGSLDAILTDCLQALQLIQKGNDISEAGLSSDEAERREESLQGEISKIKSFMEDNPQMELKYCPRDINFLADALAKHGRCNPGLSLFHRGSERPWWLEKLIRSNGLYF